MGIKTAPIVGPSITVAVGAMAEKSLLGLLALLIVSEQHRKHYVTFHLTSLSDLSIRLVCPTSKSDDYVVNVENRTDQLDPYHNDKDLIFKDQAQNRTLYSRTD